MKRTPLLRKTPLRAKIVLKSTTPLERRTPLRALKPIARWIRTWPCCVCGRKTGVIAHHMVEGDGDDRRGMSQKVSDYKTLPLCEGPNVNDSHHKQFHRRLGDFAGWSNERRRCFQEEEATRMKLIWDGIQEHGTTQEPDRIAV